MAETISKRLHVSGLTTQITPSDLSARFSTFGTVRSLDGLGELDGNGQPRPYAYVTLEASKPQLAKCLNLLSGTTWKGAKLRIGEAKPDFRERILLEHRPAEENDVTRAKKRKGIARGCQGTHCTDMSLVTPQTVSSRPGWYKTPMGRLIRPIRMRPARPLGEQPVAAGKASKSFKKSKDLEKKILMKKKKKGKAMALIRQRRRLIDPVKWGSECLKGVLLESVRIDTRHDAETIPQARNNAQEPASKSSVTPMEVENVGSVSLISSSHQQKSKHVAFATEDLESVEAEKSRNLGLINELFGGKGEHEWGLGGDLPSDIEIDDHDGLETVEQTKVTKRDDEGDSGLGEELRDEKEDSEGEGDDSDDSDEEEFDTDEDTSEEDNEDDEGLPEDVPEPKRKKQKTNRQTGVEAIDEENMDVVPSISYEADMDALKDLFGPGSAEEAQPFSLLGSLGIDLELDDEYMAEIGLAPPPPAASGATLPAPIALSSTTLVPAPSQAPAKHIAAAQATSKQITPSHVPQVRPTIYDSGKPLFFPLSLLDTSGSKSRPKDFLEAIGERGWGVAQSQPQSHVKSNLNNSNTISKKTNFSDDAATSGTKDDMFWRTESSEEIRKRWEDSKLELTRTWKKRHREAVKSMRRRGGVERDD